MNKKSAFQWGRRIRTGVAKIDAGNIAGLGGVMRVLVVVERGAAPTLLSSSRRCCCEHSSSALPPQFSSAQDESISASFLSRERFFGEKERSSSPLFFFTFCSPGSGSRFILFSLRLQHI
jgi:hypothetical protein